jgi:hypothetical protein
VPDTVAGEKKNPGEKKMPVIPALRRLWQEEL